MFTIKKVSERLDIPVVTLRAWEKRYQFIRPTRTDGGHRLYSQEDIDKLKWVKQQIEEKDIKISEAVSLLEKRTQRSIYTDLIDTLYRQLISLNTVQAHQTIDLAFSLYHHHHVFHDILTPVLYRVGDEWEQGNLSVAQEHYATQLIIQRCSHVLWSLPVQPDLPSVLSFCPEGENHHMGLMLFSLFLKNKGLDITYLGADTPLKDLSTIIKMKSISLIAISLTDPSKTQALEKWIEECQEEFAEVMFVLGGAGFQHQPAIDATTVLSGDRSDWENWYQTFMSGA